MHGAIATRPAVNEALAGSVGPALDIVEFDIDDVGTFNEVTGERELVLDVPIADDIASFSRLDLLDPGLYPITIQIRRDRTVVASHTTFLERTRNAGPGLGPLSFALIAGVDDIGPTSTNADVARATEQLEDLAAFAEATQFPLMAVVPPAYTAELLSAELGERLAAAIGERSLLGLPDLDLDPSAAAAANLTSELDRRYRDGAQQLTNAFPDATVEPTVALVTDALTPRGAAALRDQGVTLLLAQFDRYSQLTGSNPQTTDTSLLVNATLPDGSPTRIAVIDPIMELLDPDRRTDLMPAEAALKLIATASVMRYDRGPDRRSLVLATPDFGVPDPEVIAHLAAFIDAHPDFNARPLAEIADLTNSFFVDGAEVIVELDTAPAISLIERAQRSEEMGLRIADVASMLPTADERTEAWTESVRNSLSTALTDSEAAVRIDAVESALLRVRDDVLAPDPFRFTLTGRETSIPLRVENVGSTPLRIAVRVTAEKLTVPGDVEVVLNPNATTDVPVPVIARSNGVFPVLVELLTPAGNQLTEPVELTARVNSLAGLGRVATVGAGFVLITWWYTHLRRKRNKERASVIADSRGRHPANGFDDPPEDQSDDQPDISH